MRGVLLDKLQAGAGAPGNAMEAFQYTMLGLLVLMCFGEPTVRAFEDGERAWLLYISQQMSIFFFPSITKHIFRGRLQATHALRLRQMELFVLLINAQRAYKRQVKEEGQAPTSETMFQHSYVDTLLDITLPKEGHRPLTDDEIITLCARVPLL